MQIKLPQLAADAVRQCRRMTRAERPTVTRELRLRAAQTISQSLVTQLAHKVQAEARSVTAR